MARVSTRDPMQLLGTAFIEALGIDPTTCRGIVLRAHVGEIVTVDVELFPTEEQGEEIAQAARRFGIVKVVEYPAGSEEKPDSG